MKRLILRKRNLLLLLIPLGIFVTEWAKSSAYIAEELFAKKIYKVLMHVGACLTGWLPFSLAEAVAALAIFSAPAVLVWFIVRLVRVRAKVAGDAIAASRTMQSRQVAKIRFEMIMTGVQNILCLIAVIFFGYVMGCGVNYYRYPVSVYLGLDVKESSVEELAGLVEELADTATALRRELTTVNEKGVYELPMSNRELGKEARAAYGALAEQYTVFDGNLAVPKPVAGSLFMSYANTTGVFTCWTMEANVNVHISPYSIASTMCHELAHVQGFMREDEANYIAYLACMASDCKDLQYSGTMLALIYAGNALYGKDAQRYFEIMAEHYGEGVLLDLQANNEYWDRFEKTVVSEVAEKVNDTYLKVNEQDDGIQSYGRVVDLLLAEYRQRSKARQ